MDEANVTCRKRLASIGLDNTDANGQAYRTMLVTAPAFGQYVSGLDGLPSLSAAYYQQEYMFAPYPAYYCEHPNGPSALAVKEAAWGLARYAAIS
ncbi:hypothetical protein JRO89_XS08G0134800 [Xanthoceras sorbifolium]|uniref:fructose-bisphosphate aldolase n=1 Tax=Xanthoceras sorbifolium TaxID=99658 RepID=A0ABQ8HPQ9_9ROSI|nr:hypothetical protein JRO89_XS08G0134800 [Xanthoceras sorbifolium]